MALALSNAELREISDRHMGDEDIVELIAFILHLKRQLAEAQAKVRRQRKNLNGIRKANIRFDDWEAEKMRDPEFRAAAEELEPEYQAARQRIIKNTKDT